MEESLKLIGDIIKEEGLGRNFRGIWIPAAVWLNEKLSIEEKTLWAEIDSLEGEDGCFASNSYFARFLGKSERQIRYYLKHLKDEKLIEVKNPGGKDRKIFSVYQKPTRQWPLRTRQSIAYIGGNPLPTDNKDYNYIYSKEEELPTVDQIKEIKEFLANWKPPSEETLKKFREEIKKTLKKPT